MTEIGQNTEDISSGEDYSNITLRPMDVSDTNDVMVWESDVKVTKFWSEKGEDVINYMNEALIPHPWLRAICLEGRAIGYISVTPFDDHEVCRCEVGYVLASKYWGRGIATRVVKMVASTIFVDQPHLERLEALVGVDTIRSQRVLGKSGFQREGVMRKYMVLKGSARDVVVFSLVRTDPSDLHIEPVVGTFVVTPL